MDSGASKHFTPVLSDFADFTLDLNYKQLQSKLPYKLKVKEQYSSHIKLQVNLGLLKKSLHASSQFIMFLE